MNNIIVSLTSYPARIGSVHLAIESILAQSLKPEGVVLWLAPEQFPDMEAALPPELLALRSRGLAIDWYDDIKSYKKLIPALKKYPESIIVTADDDTVYEQDWLKKLYEAYLLSPDMIHCHRAHRVSFYKKRLAEYNDWLRISDVRVAACCNNFFTGNHGVLYPPHALHKDVFLEEQFMSVCPSGDDIWFWCMAVLQGTKINVVTDNMRGDHSIEGTQDSALWLENVYYKNNVQLAAVLNRYPQLHDRLDRSSVIFKRIRGMSLKNRIRYHFYLSLRYKLRNRGYLG